MTAALIAMTGGVIGMIGVTNGRCTGTDTAGFTNVVQRYGLSDLVHVVKLKLTLESEKAEHIVLRLFLSITFIYVLDYRWSISPSVTMLLSRSMKMACVLSTT